MVLRNVTVIDGTGTPPQPGRVVVVENGAIEGVYPALLQRITAEAHRQGLKVWAHATVFPSVPSVHLGTTLHVAHQLAQREGIERGWSPAAGARQKEWDCRATKAAHEAGVSLVAGTDLDGSVPIQEEMALLVSCGLSPLDAITAATSAAAHAIGIERSHGSVTAGKAADLVLLGSDPTADIRNATDVVWVMKAGRRYEPPVAN